MSPKTRGRVEIRDAAQKDRADAGLTETKGGAVYEGLCALCATCERRFYCMFPTPAAGFWRCDQYLGV